MCACMLQPIQQGPPAPKVGRNGIPHLHLSCPSVQIEHAGTGDSILCRKLDGACEKLLSGAHRGVPGSIARASAAAWQPQAPTPSARLHKQHQARTQARQQQLVHFTAAAMHPLTSTSSSSSCASSASHSLRSARGFLLGSTAAVWNWNEAIEVANLSNAGLTRSLRWPYAAALSCPACCPAAAHPYALPCCALPCYGPKSS